MWRGSHGLSPSAVVLTSDAMVAQATIGAMPAPDAQPLSDYRTGWPPAVSPTARKVGAGIIAIMAVSTAIDVWDGEPRITTRWGLAGKAIFTVVASSLVIFGFADRFGGWPPRGTVT